MTYVGNIFTFTNTHSAPERNPLQLSPGGGFATPSPSPSGRTRHRNQIQYPRVDFSYSGPGLFFEAEESETVYFSAAGSRVTVIEPPIDVDDPWTAPFIGVDPRNSFYCTPLPTPYQNFGHDFPIVGRVARPGSLALTPVVTPYSAAHLPADPIGVLTDTAAARQRVTDTAGLRAVIPTMQPVTLNGGFSIINVSGSSLLRDNR